MPDLFNFTTAGQIKAFVDEILALKELIKCPVCLEPTKNPVRINCDHIFCSDCLDSFINTFKDHTVHKVPLCPICRKSVNRQRKTVNAYVEAVLKFVNAATKQVQDAFGCDISLLTKIGSIEAALKKKNEHKNLPNLRRLSTSSSNIIQPTEQVEVTDAFDELLKSTNKQQNSVKKKYTKKSKNVATKEENRVVISNKIQNFDTKENKENIVQWLQDTKNKFERMTQTQDLIADNDNDTQFSFDNPSVSQDFVLLDKPKVRPRSLDVTVKTPLVKKKRHTFPSQLQEIKPIDIEDDSDERNKDKGQNKIKKSSTKKKGNKTSLKNKTDWNRIEKINKTINNSVRQTKMLPVSLTSSTPKEKNPVVILEKIQVENLQKNDHEITPQADFECLGTTTSQKTNKSLAKKILPDEDPISPVETCQNITTDAIQEPQETISINPILLDDAASIIEELKSFVKICNVKKTKSCILSLKLIVEHLIKTFNKSQSSPFFRGNSIASTQTVNFDMKSVGVQTEGLQEQFKTRENPDKDKTIKINENFELTDSFDNIDFDTQQVLSTKSLDKNSNSNSNKTEKILHNTQKNTTQLPSTTNNISLNKEDNVSSQVTSDLPRSVLEFSLSNRSKIDNREMLKKSVSEAIKTYKRIRTLDSDSENESSCKKKKLENKYLARNLSVEMLSEDVLEDDGEPFKATDGSLSLDKCNEVDYDAYLNNILKKYDDNTPNKKQNQQILIDPKPSTSKKTDSQNVLDMCEAMIRNAETKKLTNPPHTSERKGSKTKTLDNNDIQKQIETEEDIPEVVRASPIDVAMAEEFDEPFGALPQSAAFKLSTETFMANMDIDKFPITTIEKSVVETKDVDDDDNPVISNMDAIVEEYGRDFYETNQDKSSLASSKVTILQNIVITPKKTKNQRRNSALSEEMFNSDAEEDVIEMTPKKNTSVTRKSFSQLTQKSLLQVLLPPPPTEDSPDVILPTNATPFLDQTFAPPTEFQDLGNIERTAEPPITIPETNEDDLDITMIPTENKETDLKQSQLFQSMTESEIMRFMSNGESNVFTSTLRENTIITSTQKPLARDVEQELSLGISPIRCQRKRLNLIEAAQQSKFSPLDVISVKSQTPPRVLTPAQTKQKSILSFMQQDKKNTVLNDSICSASTVELMPAPTKPLKPCICFTRLSKEQIVRIASMTNKKLATSSNSFSTNVTHLVVSVNENNCILDHTMKFLMAVATGKWVVNFQWIQDCLNQNRIVPEAPYEALDVSGLPGPRNSRILRKRRPLFSGYKIHIVPPFVSTSKEEVEELVTLMGGELIPTLDMIPQLSGIRVIITEAKSTQDFFRFEGWLETYKVLTVDIEWLSRSIGQYKLLSLRSFALCSDETIEHLGYPPELTVETPNMSET